MKFPKRNVRVNIVANVAKGVTEPVAKIDCDQKSMEIENPKTFKAMWNKTAINTEAKNLDEIYDTSQQGKEGVNNRIIKLAKMLNLSENDVSSVLTI